MGIDCFNSFHYILGGDEGEEYTLVGYPTNEGNGAFLNTTYSRYAICADTPPEVQEGAWEFIRMLADEDFCCDMSNAYNNLVGFPVNRAAFERLAQEELNRPEEEQYSYGNMTQAEYERLCAYPSAMPPTGPMTRSSSPTMLWKPLSMKKSTCCSRANAPHSSVQI